jgi:hypothetical protein
MIAGTIIDLVILLIGDLLYDTKMSVGGAILGSVLAILVAKVLEFFRFCVDYSRTEKVQFEDDEYYYYVKAVPKLTVAAQSKTVKRINTQSRVHSSMGGRTEEDNRGRSVMTERTPGRHSHGNQNQRGVSARNRGITINSGSMEDISEEFEDIN